MSLLGRKYSGQHFFGLQLDFFFPKISYQLAVNDNLIHILMFKKQCNFSVGKKTVQPGNFGMIQAQPFKIQLILCIN